MTQTLPPSPPQLDVVSFLDDRGLRYLPRLNPYTGSVNATIFLLRSVHWWNYVGRRPFWKFFGPCSHALYRAGDSWQEDLGFTRAETESALEKVGSKVKQGTSRAEILEIGGIRSTLIYWTERDHRTYFEVNEIQLWQVVIQAYLYSEIEHQLSNATFKQQSSDAENQQSTSNAENQQQISSQGNELQRTNTNTSARRSAPHKPVRKKANSTKPKDLRSKHPAIGLLRGVLGHWPAKAYWDDILALADPETSGLNKLNERRLKDMIQLFMSHGGFKNDVLTWLFDWYVHGVPERWHGRPVTGPLADKYRRIESAKPERNNEAPERSVLRQPKSE